MFLVAAENQHVALVEQMMFAASNEFDLAPFAGQIFACAFFMRNTKHASASLKFCARDLQPRNRFCDQWPDLGALTLAFSHL